MPTPSISSAAAPSITDSPTRSTSSTGSSTKSTSSTTASRSTKSTPVKSSSQYVTDGVLHGTGYTYKVPAGYVDTESNTGMDSYVYNTKDKAKLGITIKTPGPDETACSIRDNAIKEYRDKGAAKAEPDLSFNKIQGCGISFSDDDGIFIVYIIIRDGRVYQILNYADKASYEKRLVMIKSVAESWSWK